MSSSASSAGSDPLVVDHNTDRDTSEHSERIATSELEAQSSCIDGKTSELDGKSSEPDGHTSEPDGQPSEHGGKTSESDSKTSKNDGTASESDGKTSEDDGMASESGGKASLDHGTPSESTGSDGSTPESDGETSESYGKTSGSDGGQPMIPADESFMVWELACHPESTLTAIADSVGLRTRRLTLETGWDLSLDESRCRALVLARRENPRKVWVSLPCTAWSCMQNANRRTRLQRTRLMIARHHSRQCLSVCLPVCEQVVAEGGHFYFEWPAKCHGWKVVELLRFIGVLEGKGVQLYRCRIDGCAYGLKNRAGTHFLLKPWTILTNDPTMHQLLNKRCPRDHLHATIQGGETTRSAYYPKAMAATVVLAWVRAGSG